jgi:hypothetical protein
VLDMFDILRVLETGSISVNSCSRWDGGGVCAGGHLTTS